MEIINRLQHWLDVALKLRDKIAALEDDLIKALEEKKQLLGEVLDVEGVRVKSRCRGDELQIASGKLKAVEDHIKALDDEVERYVHEIPCQHIVNDDYVDDNNRKEEEVRKLKEKVEMTHEFLYDKQMELEDAQGVVLSSRVEVGKLSKENHNLRAEIHQLSVVNQGLVGDWNWLITQEFQHVFKCIRGSNEYVRLWEK